MNNGSWRCHGYLIAANMLCLPQLLLNFALFALYKIKNLFFLGAQDIVRLLIEKGADVNKKSKNGYTPLHMTAEFSK